MRIIAHRGNVFGPQPDMENYPEYIDYSISLGYDVEIDVWFLDDKFFLGHDNPQYEVPLSFFVGKPLWIHCKNIYALEELSVIPALNAFYHDKEDVIMTRNGYLWTAPSKLLTEKSIAVMPELAPEWDISNACGICTDFADLYYERYRVSNNNL